MNTIVAEVKEALKAAGSPETRESAGRFFKDGEKVDFHGVKSAEVRKIAMRSLPRLKDMKKADVLKACEELWKSGFLEEGSVACEWAYSRHKEFDAADIKTFERWIDRYVGNWASCDTLCNHTVAALVEAHPELIGNLKSWTGSKNRWKKRAAAVTLILPARKGLFLDDIFRIAETLLTDPDDMVQKGYGWMLKAASEAHRDRVYEYVVSKKNVMPRTAYRYALEKMPEDMRAKAMKR